MLRVAYAGYDFFSSCLAALCERDDVQVVLCLTGEVRETVDNVVGISRTSGIPVLFGRLSKNSISILNEKQVDLLVCAAYSYRIPIEKLSVGRAVNIHPSLLPEGRGPNPLPYLVSGESKFCGISIHEMTPEFDAGPVLLSESIQLDSRDGFNELALKMFATAPRVLNRLIDQLDFYFANKEPQETGSYWPMYGDEKRTIVAAEASVETVCDVARVYGVLGFITVLTDGVRVEAVRMTATCCSHRYRPGVLVAKLKIGWVIALPDGLLRLDNPQILKP